MDILGIRIDNFSKKEVLEKVESFLSDGIFHQIATVNPEFILHSQKDAEFRNILNSTGLNVADGVGIWFAFLWFGKYLRARIAGADLMHEILRIADEKKLSVFLAINKNGLSSYEEIMCVLEKKYPRIVFDGNNFDPDNRSTFPACNDVATSGRHVPRSTIVFCNFGAPQQEKFINSVKNDIIGLAMGVGGSFDFLTEKVQRAPKIMRILGLEWLWRLVQQPKRFRRIFNATIIFPIKIIVNK